MNPFDQLLDQFRAVMREELAALSPATQEEADGWLSPESAGVLLDLSPAAVRARAARGDLPSYRLGNDGKSLRFRREDIDAYLRPVDQG